MAPPGAERPYHADEIRVDVAGVSRPAR